MHTVTPCWSSQCSCQAQGSDGAKLDNTLICRHMPLHPSRGQALLSCSWATLFRACSCGRCRCCSPACCCRLGDSLSSDFVTFYGGWRHPLFLSVTSTDWSILISQGLSSMVTLFKEFTKGSSIKFHRGQIVKSNNTSCSFFLYDIVFNSISLLPTFLSSSPILCSVEL